MRPRRRAAGYKLPPRSVPKMQAQPAEAQQRLRERDAHAADDDRTAVEVWLGDPPRWRSALGRRAER